MIDRDRFYSTVRSTLFGGKLNKSQVDGMEFILGVYENEYADRLSLYDLAYCLATAYHETAYTMLPIKEYGGNAYFTRMYDITGNRPSLARRYGNTTLGDGPKYCGRGYVQLTWKINYDKASRILGLDLVNNPDMVMQPDIAARIMFQGMYEGWFTGRRLGHYITDTEYDFVEARRIINGTDKAQKIANEADRFLSALID